MKKKLLATFLAVAFVLTTFPATVLPAAAAEPTTGVRYARKENRQRNDQYVNGHLAYEKRGNVQYFYFYDSFGKLSSIRFYDPAVNSGSAQNYFTLTNHQGDVVAIYILNSTYHSNVFQKGSLGSVMEILLPQASYS